MISKNKIKLIKSLELKKYRNELQLFVAEGNKLVGDMLPYFECELLVAKSAWLKAQGNIEAKEVIIAEEEDLHKASLLKTPQEVLALFRKPHYDLKEVCPEKDLVLASDGIQDPGNLGTIIRLADWFGIRHIVCSFDTVDAFSPKVVQATMGALARVKVHYTDLEHFLTAPQNSAFPLYGTFLDGENIYDKPLRNNGIIVMGNEGNGIRPAIGKLVNERLFIPNYPQGESTSESLNVAIATAIVCAEFRRRQVNIL